MSKSLENRPYQSRIITKADNNWRTGVKSQLVVSPTGSGKTVMGFSILKGVVENAPTIMGCEPTRLALLGWRCAGTAQAG